MIFILSRDNTENTVVGVYNTLDLLISNNIEIVLTNSRPASKRTILNKIVCDGVCCVRIDFYSYYITRHKLIT